MSVALPTLRVGDPIRHESLSVFPLFCDSGVSVDYRLSESALADNSVLVEEIDEDGSVPELLVENKGDMRVLFLEGEELIGAKQNRVLNTSVLVPAKSKLKIPVSCVERGRWARSTKYFGSSGSHTPAKLRKALKASVSKNLKEKKVHRSDQGEVWREVAFLSASHGVDSCTDAMSDVFATHSQSIEAYRERLQYVEGACGVAVAISGRVVSVDLFDKASTCQKVWNRILSGVVFDALEARGDDGAIPVETVEKFIADVGQLPWEPSQAVGEGDEYRAESSAGDHASALSLQETVVHGSVSAAV